MKAQTAKMMASRNEMHFHYVSRWKLWGLYHLNAASRNAQGDSWFRDSTLSWSVTCVHLTLPIHNIFDACII